MVAKNSSTLHRCTELTKWPTLEVCHHVDAADGEHEARDETTTRRQGQHAEDVDPRGDIGRLPVGQPLTLGHQTLDPPGQGCGPAVPSRRAAGSATTEGLASRVGSSVLVLTGFGNGSTSASTKTRIIARMTTRLATVIVTHPHWTTGPAGTGFDTASNWVILLASGSTKL